VRCFVVAGFLLTSASRGPSALAELLVKEIIRIGLLIGLHLESAQAGVNFVTIFKTK